MTDFIWKGKSLVTIGDLSDAILAITERDEAAEFMAAYRAVEPEYADQNIGYLTGYYSPEEAKQKRDLFDVSHPIFGRKSPTPEAAIEAGKRWAQDA